MISGCAPCDDDSGTNNDNYFTQNFGSEVSRDFIGQIVDQNGSPIQNAEVKSEQQQLKPIVMEFS